MKKKIVYSVDPVVKASAQLQKQIDEELEDEQEEKSIGALLNETQSNSERGESSSNEGS
jgi:hypothetical protein